MTVVRPWHLTSGEAEIREQRVAQAPLREFLASRREQLLEKRRRRGEVNWWGRELDERGR